MYLLLSLLEVQKNLKKLWVTFSTYTWEQTFELLFSENVFFWFIYLEKLFIRMVSFSAHLKKAQFCVP